MKRPLLVLRPQPGNAATVARATALGFDVMGVPLFEIVPRVWEAPDPEPFEALMVTSPNTVRHGGAQLARYTGLPAYAVGETTADALRKTGFSDVRVGPGDAVGLIALLRHDGVARVLHLCGVDRREPDAHGIEITRVELYEARAIEIPPGLAEAVARAPVALLHSPRAAARFAELVARRGGIALAAISRNAAEAAGRGWQAFEIAAAPTDHALLEIAARMCKQENGNLRDAPQ